MNVLVVDAAAEVRDQASRALSREGFAVITAADGAQGLALARAQRPALVVLDQMLPIMEGLEVARRVREESDIPVLMLSAHPDQISASARASAGVDDYLSKPFKPRELVM